LRRFGECADFLTKCHVAAVRLYPENPGHSLPDRGKSQAPFFLFRGESSIYNCHNLSVKTHYILCISECDLACTIYPFCGEVRQMSKLFDALQNVGFTNKNDMSLTYAIPLPDRGNSLTSPFFLFSGESSIYAATSKGETRRDLWLRRQGSRPYQHLLGIIPARCRR
jgi:hypothetical protein